MLNIEFGFALPHQLNPHLPGMSNQGTQHSSSHTSQTISPYTLLIRHLPEAIPLDTLSRLFSHYGASSVRPLSGGRLKNSAFVDFKDEASAFQAHRQLNGLRFLGKVLSVEKASKNIHDDKHVKNESVNDSNAVARDVFKGGSFQEASKSGCVPAGEPIAEKVGVDYPFPPHIEYSYPPPDGNILTNIVNALIAVPRFYTQVLHLMNKMNIPAPFRPALPTPPLPDVGQSAAPPPPPPPPITENPSPAVMSSDESEMETSDEEIDDGAQARRKRIKRENIVGPAVDKDVAHEAVGLKPATLVPKEVPVIKKKNPVLQIKIAPKQIQPENMAKSVAEEPDEVMEVVDDKAFATAEEIGRHKLPPEELLSLPMFKNYSTGNPACVLYIKNLAKDVVVDDFFFIFGSLFGSINAAKSVLGVRLMQEGRMRGQAFLTFPSVELAHHALNLVNGYVFKGKPMIIQFGRNPAASKAS